MKKNRLLAAADIRHSVEQSDLRRRHRCVVKPYAGDIARRRFGRNKHVVLEKTQDIRARNLKRAAVVCHIDAKTAVAVSANNAGSLADDGDLNIGVRRKDRVCRVLKLQTPVLDICAVVGSSVVETRHAAETARFINSEKHHDCIGVVRNHARRVDRHAAVERKAQRLSGIAVNRIRNKRICAAAV